MPRSAATAYRAGSFDALEQRVYGLEQGISSLATNTSQQINALSNQISGLSSKLEERARIPWPALGVMLSFITIIGALVWYPEKERGARLEAAITKMDDRYLTSKEFEARFFAGGQRRDDLQKLVDQRMARVEGDLDGVQKGIVPRGEHEERWRGNDARFGDIQRQIDGMKRDFGDLYNPRDAFTNFQKKLDDLERELRKK